MSKRKRERKKKKKERKKQDRKKERAGQLTKQLRPPTWHPRLKTNGQHFKVTKDKFDIYKISP